MENNVLLGSQLVWESLSVDIKNAISKNASLFSPGFPWRAFLYSVGGGFLLAFAVLFFTLAYTGGNLGALFCGIFVLAMSIAVFADASILYQNHRLLQHAYAIIFIANFLRFHQYGFTEEFKEYLKREKNSRGLHLLLFHKLKFVRLV